MPKRESTFQHNLIIKLKKIFPGCLVLKNDANYAQGIPDLLIIYKDKWAMLECKRHKPTERDFRPNQEYYISKYNDWSYAAVIYPENEKEILNELRQALESVR